MVIANLQTSQKYSSTWQREAFFDRLLLNFVYSIRLMADKLQNPPAEPTPKPADMKETIACLEREFNNKLLKFKVACNSLHTFVGNKQRFKGILNLCTEPVVINRDKKLAPHLDELQNRIAKCLQYYHKLCDLVNGAEWQKAMKHCEEMKNQKSISKWVGCGGLVIAVGAVILFWPFGLISSITATVGVLVGAAVSSAGFYYSSTCNSKILEECEKAFQECKTIQVHLEEIQDELRRFWDIKEKKERKHTLQDIKRKITACTAKMTEGNPPEENNFTNLAKEGFKYAANKMDELYSRK